MYSETTPFRSTSRYKPFYLKTNPRGREPIMSGPYHVRIENRGKETFQLRHPGIGKSPTAADR